MATSQDFIHKLEVGAGRRVFRVGLGILLFVLLVVGYNWRGFKNMAAPEAMDAAQLARNIAQGRGYNTWCIRPFSMYLMKQHQLENDPAALGLRPAELTRIKDLHPDIANPPVYPVVLAGLMKVLPFRFTIPSKPKAFWFYSGRFWRSQPDFLIALFNELLFFLVILLGFFLARRLFDLPVAILSAILLLCTDLLWRFSVSGLSTMLLMLLFMGLAWCLFFLEQEGREPVRPRLAVIGLGVASGLLVGVGFLTRYSLGWLIIPLLLFLILFTGQYRFIVSPAAFVAFLLVATPWVVRNYRVSGTPFGTAGYAVLETSMFAEHRLERSLEPNLRKVPLTPFWRKLLVNTRQVLQNDLPKLGGTWLSAFFLVGLLIRYPHPGVTRLRYFILLCLAVLVVVQALGKTQLSEDNPDINSENLLVLVAPLVLAYGVSLFFLVLDQLEFPTRELRYATVVGFSLLVSLPLIYNFLPPSPTPISSPYNPPFAQRVGQFVKENGVCVSDVPWAMAWYGQAPSIWLPLSASTDFLDINDFQKPVDALYLTRTSLDSRFFSVFVVGAKEGWGTLMLQVGGQASQELEKWPRRVSVALRGPDNTPITFPLHFLQESWPEQLLLTASDKPARGP